MTIVDTYSTRLLGCLNCLCHAMYGCTQEAKIDAYKALVPPHVEYAYAVWEPYTACDIALLDTAQNRAARWIKGFWDPIVQRWSNSSADCVRELK